MLTKDKKDPDRLVVAWQSFATNDRVINVGEKLRASDPAVGNGRWFDELDLPDSERTNLWNEMLSPPVHAPAVEVRSIEVPLYRQVRSRVSVSAPAQWAPGSPGSKSGFPAPFARVVLTIGAIHDVLSPIVKEHPEWFEIPRRDLTAEDIERIERLEQSSAKTAKAK